MSALSLFPARVPIGRFQGPDGKDVDVLSTPEFVRALAAVFDRLGGANGIGNDDLAALVFQAMVPSKDTTARDAIFSLELSAPNDHGAAVTEIKREMDELRIMVSTVSNAASQVAALHSSLQEIAIMSSYSDPFRIDWEHPGKIGASTPNTGAFTTLTASAAVALSPANANVVLSPTGTGLVTINPATTGAMDNVVIGAGTAKAVTCTALTATGAAALSPANANVVISPTGTGLVTINPTTAGTINNVSIGATTAATVIGTTVTATGALKTGITGAAGVVQIVRASDGAVVGTDTMNGNTREIDNQAGDIVLLRGSTERTRVTATGLTVAGTLTPTGAFGCNTKTAQTAVASGGALAAYGAGANGLDTGANMSALHALVVSIRAALVANGIMS